MQCVVYRIVAAMAEKVSEQKVTPWEARAAEGEASIDYDKLIRELYNNINIYLSVLIRREYHAKLLISA